MKQIFFIGVTELILSHNVPLGQFDPRFQTQALSPQKKVYISISEEEKLPFPPCSGVYSLPEFQVWFDGEREYRRYRAKYNKEEFLVSCMEPDGNILLNVKSGSEWNCIKIWGCIHLEELLLYSRALILHSASIIYRGRAVLFTAPSGTGKTTQTNLWHKYCKDTDDLNGDRTLLQRTRDGWFACGFPIYGGSMRCEQAAVPIRAIVVIRQAQADAVHELSSVEKLTALYSESTVFSAKRECVEQAMSLLDDLIRHVQVLRLDCTMEQSAVDVLHHYLYGET